MTKGWSLERELMACTVEGLSALLVSFITAWSKDPPADLKPVVVPRPDGLVVDGRSSAGDVVHTAPPPTSNGPRKQSSAEEIVAFLGSTGGSLRVDPATNGEEA